MQQKPSLNASIALNTAVAHLLKVAEKLAYVKG